MTAEDILEKHGVLRKGAKTFPINLTRDTGIGTRDAILAAMKEIAEIAFEAGYNNGAIENNAFISKADPTIKYPNKQDFITSLFPKKEVFTIPSNTLEIRGLE